MAPSVNQTVDLAAAHPWPHFEPDEIEAATRVLASGRVNYWTGGEGRAFEREYAEHLGRGHAIALANGTVALELALIALGVGEGAEVITTPRTFMASASSAVMRGATPVFADVDRDSGNITAASIEAVLTPLTRAIIVVHLAGWPAEMGPILDLARAHGIAVVEDCAQAHGASYEGAPVGSFGDAAAFSFCQDKILTTAGEGGLLALDDGQAWRRAWSFKDHGKDFDEVHRDDHPPGYRWLHRSFGTNWRLSEVQSAVGRVQLRKLGRWVAARRRNAKILHDRFADLDLLRTPVPREGVEHAYYKFYTYVERDRFRDGWDRERLQGELLDAGVRTWVGSCSEIYREGAFAASGLTQDPLPTAAELGDTSLMFQVHPTIDGASMERIADTSRDIVVRATR